VVKKLELRPKVHTYMLVLANDFVTAPEMYMRIRTVLCNMPVHHVVSTLNILNTQQARPTTGNLCTYGAIFAYSSRSAYSNVRALVR